MAVLLGSRETAALETVHLHRSGTQIPVSCRMAPLTDSDGRVYGASAVVRDNSREMSLRRQLERGRQEAQARFSDSALAQLTTDPNGRIVAVNRAACQLARWSSENAVLGRSLTELVPAEDREQMRTLLERLSTGELTTSRHRRRLVRGDGSLLDTYVTVFASRDDTGAVERLEAVLDDVTEQLASERARERSERKWHYLARNAADVAVMCDAQARVTFVSAAVTSRLGYDSADVVGADGFSFFHPDDEPAVRQHWARVLAEPGDSITFQARIRAANGQWRWVEDTLTNYLHVPEVEAVVANIVEVTGREAVTPAAALLIDDLRRGMLADEFVVRYQPVLSLLDGRVAGVEALVRWQHPARGTLGPMAFIEPAETSGLIVKIGQQVIADAARAAARWAHLGAVDRPFYVAVNVSAQQLTAPGVVEFISEQLSRTGARPEQLMVEVTESAVMTDFDATTRALAQLRQLGVAVAVDDFGTGYSSLTYVKRFPITALKIDRSFVSGLGIDADDDAIVASVISLARAVRVECIAEGIETNQQLHALRSLGCQYAQGFLWSPAVSADAFETWQRTHDPASVLATTGPPPVTSRPRQRGEPQPASPRVPPAIQARIARLHREGASLATIAAALNAEQLLTNDAKRWHTRSVARIVASLPG